MRCYTYTFATTLVSGTVWRFEIVAPGPLLAWLKAVLHLVSERGVEFHVLTLEKVE